MSLQPFHLAIPVHNLAQALDFYHGTLGCSLGRQSDQWIDFDFFGHQLVTHLAPDELMNGKHSSVDGDSIPVRHFGIVLLWKDWERLGEKLLEAKVDFIIKPKIRFVGENGEQGTFFVKDPSGNALEFKTFKDQSQLFAH